MLMSGEKQYDNTIIHLFTNIKVAMKRKLRLSLLSYCDMPSWTKKTKGGTWFFSIRNELDHWIIVVCDCCDPIWVTRCPMQALFIFDLPQKMSNRFKRATAEWTVEHLRATLWRYWMNQCCWTNLLDEWFNGSLERQSLVSSLNDILTASGNLVSWLVASLPYQAMIRYTSRNWFQTDFWCNETV